MSDIHEVGRLFAQIRNQHESDGFNEQAIEMFSKLVEEGLEAAPEAAIGHLSFEEMLDLCVAYTLHDIHGYDDAAKEVFFNHLTKDDRMRMSAFTGMVVGYMMGAVVSHMQHEEDKNDRSFSL